MGGRMLKVAAAALFLVALDQLTKLMAESWLTFASPVTVIPYVFDLHLVYNTGAAFSAFAGWAGARWLFMAVQLAAVALAFWLARGTVGQTRLAQLALGLIAGGALGNFIDRARLGKVVDFIDWHLGDLHWPVFNLADAGISVGAVLLGWLILRGRA